MNALLALIKKEIKEHIRSGHSVCSIRHYESCHCENDTMAI